MITNGYYPDSELFTITQEDRDDFKYWREKGLPLMLRFTQFIKDNEPSLESRTVFYLICKEMDDVYAQKYVHPVGYYMFDLAKGLKSCLDVYVGFENSKFINSDKTSARHVPFKEMSQLKSRNVLDKENILNMKRYLHLFKPVLIRRDMLHRFFDTYNVPRFDPFDVKENEEKTFRHWKNQKNIDLYRGLKILFEWVDRDDEEEINLHYLFDSLPLITNEELEKRPFDIMRDTFYLLGLNHYFMALIEQYLVPEKRTEVHISMGGETEIDPPYLFELKVWKTWKNKIENSPEIQYGKTSMKRYFHLFYDQFSDIDLEKIKKEGAELKKKLWNGKPVEIEKNTSDWEDYSTYLHPLVWALYYIVDEEIFV